MINKLYGNNLIASCLSRKYVIGIRRDAYLVMEMVLLFSFIFILWIAFFAFFYNLLITIAISIFFAFFLIYYLLCFFTEPGIIPRNKEKGAETANTNPSNGNSCDEIINKNKDLKKVVSIFPQEVEIKENERKNKEKEELNNSLIFVKDEVITTAPLEINDHVNKELNENNDSVNASTTTSSPLPLIFQKRRCYTCNILRPSKSSHCRICDNCIFNLDHHCFYISNCVGERNHKYFFLFLVFGVLISGSALATSGYHFIFILITEKKITESLIRNYKVQIMISAAGLITSPFVYLTLNQTKISILLVLTAVTMYSTIYYLNLSNFQNKRISIKFFFTHHPFGLSLVCLTLPLFLFAFSNLLKQLSMIGKGLTIKQYRSILKQRDELKKAKKNFSTMDMYLNSKFAFGNIYIFLRRNKKASLINSLINYK